MTVDVERSLQEPAGRPTGRTGRVRIVAWGIVGTLSLPASNAWIESLVGAMPTEPMLLGAAVAGSGKFSIATTARVSVPLTADGTAPEA